MHSFARKRVAIASWCVALALASSCGARSELPIDEFDQCIEFSSQAHPADLDLFLLIDSSESMNGLTADNTTKWNEVAAAINAFVKHPSLSGTGAAITFFPQRRLDVPAFCTGDNTCGEPGACHSIGICMPDGGDACLTDAHCDEAGLSGNTCEPLGQCANSDVFCVPGQADDFCAGAPCLDVGVCTNRTVCAASAYELASPQKLPAAANGIISALTNRQLGGGTPTWPAVQGAINSAKSWQQSRPTHKSIVVLATDGMPSTCDPSIAPLFPDDFSVTKVVAAVAEGAQAGISTFVIGVFRPEEADVAQANLDAVAAAGSDSEAFIVTTDNNVDGQFLQALLNVRNTASTCVYALDWKRTHKDNRYVVTLVNDGRSRQLTRVANAAACDGNDQFYFDPEPVADANRAQINLCPAICEAVHGKPDKITLHVTCPVVSAAGGAGGAGG